MCKNLCDLNLIERCGEIATDDNEISNGRAVQLLQLKRARFYSLLVINTVFEQSLNLCEYGNSQIIKFQSFKTDSATHLASICADFIAAHKDLKDKLITIVIASQASLEQGENGIVFRDNVLQESNFNLSSMVFAKTSVRCFVYNYALGHLLCLKYSPFTHVDHALALMCGEGSVAMGLFINGEIILGPNHTFPKCSALPFKYGFEKSLGSMGKHTKDALTVLAPIFKIYRVFISISTFNDKLKLIHEVQLELQAQASPVLSQIKRLFVYIYG